MYTLMYAPTYIGYIIRRLHLRANVAYVYLCVRILMFTLLSCVYACAYIHVYVRTVICMHLNLCICEGEEQHTPGEIQ